MAVQLSRRLFTVDEYYRMAKAGVFKDGERVELLDGEIVPMNPIGTPHFWCVNRLTQILVIGLGTRFVVSVKNPVELDGHAEPEPDFAILRLDAPRNRKPGPDETLLVIEVADKSIKKDRGRKRAMYSRARIQEYWIVNLSADHIEVYRQPSGRGYRSTTLLSRGETVSPLCAPDLVVEVSAVLGEPETAAEPAE